MKKLILILISILLVMSCSPCLLKNQYSDTPVIVESSKSFDESWSKVIDYFALKGITIKTIEKSSGIIIAEQPVNFITYVTKENNAGGLENPNAYFAIPRCSKGEPVSFTANFNVRVKNIQDKVTINVNIFNLSYTSGTYKTYIFRGKQLVETYNYPIKSTGKFEKELANFFSN